MNCKDPKAIVKINKNHSFIKKGDLFKIKKNKLDSVIIDLKSSASILFVYREMKIQLKKLVSINKIQDIYTVTKPWGYEQWLTGPKK